MSLPVLLAAAALGIAGVRAQDPAARQETKPEDVRKTITSCLLVMELHSHVEDVPLDMGTKEKPRELVLVKTRGLLLKAEPVPGYDPNGCKAAELSKAEEDLPPLYFSPGRQSVLKYPSKIEAVLTVIPGFAYYGIPNQVVTEYRRTLP